ncbi:NUDIX hydrolase [bacterium]|nr:MAG: NUDIX hydrolase [bacterium]
MAHASFNVGVKAIMKNSKGKILALEAHMNGPMAEYYDMPGGRIDEEEVGTPFSDILRREIREELGDIEFDLDPNPIAAVSWLWPNGQPMTFIYYPAKLTGGEPQISEEHLSYKWVEPTEEELDKYFTSYHRAALKQIA